MRMFIKRLLNRWQVQAKRQPMKAVDEDGLRDLIAREGLDGKYARGELKCKYCSRPINPDHVYGVFRQSGELRFVCDESDCLAALLGLLEGGDPSL